MHIPRKSRKSILILLLLGTVLLLGGNRLVAFKVKRDARKVAGLEATTQLDNEALSLIRTGASGDTVAMTRPKLLTHVVAAGETLAEIAAKYGTDVTTLKAINDLTSDSVRVGQKLTVITVKGFVHQVERGQSLWTIARLYGVTPDKIRVANNLTGDTLKQGQKLIIPGAKRPAPRPRVAMASRGAGDSRGSSTRAAISIDFSWPLSGRITSGYGWRIHPVFRTRDFHEGIDIAAPKGTPIRAASDGKVVFSGRDGSYGLTVKIDHGNGVITRYSHNSSNAVEVGDRVEKGQVIAYVGRTGVATGPHLDFGIYAGGRAMNPLWYLPGQ